MSRPNTGGTGGAGPRRCEVCGAMVSAILRTFHNGRCPYCHAPFDSRPRDDTATGDGSHQDAHADD